MNRQTRRAAAASNKLMLDLLMRGVSTRNYAAVLPDTVGVSKSRPLHIGFPYLLLRSFSNARRRKMDDSIDPKPAEDSVDFPEFPQITLKQNDGRILPKGISPVPGNHYLLVAFERISKKVSADETSRACHQDTHALSQKEKFLTPVIISRKIHHLGTASNRIPRSNATVTRSRGITLERIEVPLPWAVPCKAPKTRRTRGHEINASSNRTGWLPGRPEPPSP